MGGRAVEQLLHQEHRIDGQLGVPVAVLAIQLK